LSYVSSTSDLSLPNSKRFLSHTSGSHGARPAPAAGLPHHQCSGPMGGGHSLEDPPARGDGGGTLLLLGREARPMLLSMGCHGRCVHRPVPFLGRHVCCPCPASTKLPARPQHDLTCTARPAQPQHLQAPTRGARTPAQARVSCTRPSMAPAKAALCSPHARQITDERRG
jgi:hypothetical protein